MEALSLERRGGVGGFVCRNVSVMWCRVLACFNRKLGRLQCEGDIRSESHPLL